MWVHSFWVGRRKLKCYDCVAVVGFARGVMVVVVLFLFISLRRTLTLLTATLCTSTPFLSYPRHTGTKETRRCCSCGCLVVEDRCLFNDQLLRSKFVKNLTREFAYSGSHPLTHKFFPWDAPTLPVSGLQDGSQRQVPAQVQLHDLQRRWPHAVREGDKLGVRERERRRHDVLQLRPGKPRQAFLPPSDGGRDP